MSSAGMKTAPAIVVGSDGSSPPIDEKEITRKHPKFYLNSGDVVLKVKNVIFKVHRHFLVIHSPVIASVFDIGGVEQVYEGTDAHPLSLDDSSRGWELLLGAFYRDDPFDDAPRPGEEYICMLHLAHKYCMEILEKSLIIRLQKDTNDQKSVNLLQASIIVDSLELREEAFRGLVGKRGVLTRHEAHIMGVDLLYDVMMFSDGGKSNVKRIPDW